MSIINLLEYNLELLASYFLGHLAGSMLQELKKVKMPIGIVPFNREIRLHLLELFHV
jgi:hypothetical protein